MKKVTSTEIIRVLLQESLKKYFIMDDFFEELDRKRHAFDANSVRTHLPRSGLLQATPFVIRQENTRELGAKSKPTFSRIYVRKNEEWTVEEVKKEFASYHLYESPPKGRKKALPKKDKQAFKREAPLPGSQTMAKQEKTSPAPDLRPKISDSEPVKAVKMADGEVSAYQFGSMVIQYIEELKNTVRRKDLEMNTVLKNAMDEKRHLEERIKELEGMLAKANKAISSLNTALEVSQNHIRQLKEDCQDTRDKKGGCFKLGEIAHIKFSNGGK
jgi:hypothetical protein